MPAQSLFRELARLDAVLQARAETLRARSAPNPYAGLVVTEAEAHALFEPSEAVADRRPFEPEPNSRLGRLAAEFGLSALEATALLVSAATEVDLRYEKLFGYLQDDVTRKRPSVAFFLGLFCPTREERLAARGIFAARSPLRRHRLLELAADPQQPRTPLAGMSLIADERIAAFLMGSDTLDDRLGPRARLIEAREATASEALRDLSAAPGSIVYFHGGGREERLAAAASLGARLLAVHGGDAVLACREAVLQGAALCWENFEAFLAPAQADALTAFAADLEARPPLTVLLGDRPWEPPHPFGWDRFVRVELPALTYSDRIGLWQEALGAAPDFVEPIAGQFRLGSEQIRAAATTALRAARWRDRSDPVVTTDDLLRACRLHSNHRLADLARPIVPRRSWSDLVLPADRIEQLQEIRDSVRFRARVFEQWGFDAKQSLGKGINILFAGPSGTGKTLAAEVLAADLGLDLYRIDLSTVVSKYIGETEKNLAKIFEEAQTSNAVLFFDEADALFGRRSEVKDAHDRYANIEVNYLLQKMEEHDGVAILATNFRKNMDDAFVRRMTATIEFPFPDAANRRRIWSAVWPAAAPLAASVDFDFLARNLEISGGNIRNIATSAAFFAAAEGGAVEMKHLVRAARREYQKMGKVITAGHFGEHAIDT